MQAGREIKFQAWVPDIGQMVQVAEIDLVNGVVSWYTSEAEIMARIPDADAFLDRVKLRQFTGLRDKNGKEIYEGDIVRKIDFGYAKRSDIYGLDFDEWLKVNNVLSYEIEDDDFVKYYYVTLVDVVVMDRFPRFWLKSESFGYEGEDLVEPSDCEVIGNIYEHPEMLQAG